MRRLRFAIAVVLSLAPPLMSPLARADATESDDDRKTAAHLFAEGQKSYREGDFRHAAEAFEGAYKRAPRLPPLWNAARAWQKGGELVRAANLYASYLRKAPPSAPDRNSATSALRDLETRIARLEVHAADFSELKVDGAPIDVDDQSAASLVLYVTPGSHIVEGTLAGKVVQEKPAATAGTSMSVVLVAQQAEVVVTKPTEPVADTKTRAGWSPIVVVVGAGLTAVAGAFLIGSGIDTMNQRSTFDASPTQVNLDAGKSDELRTNALLGVTLGIGVLTGLAAIFLVDWKSHKSEQHARFRFGPTGAMLEGSF